MGEVLEDEKEKILLIEAKKIAADNSAFEIVGTLTQVCRRYRVREKICTQTLLTRSRINPRAKD